MSESGRLCLGVENFDELGRSHYRHHSAVGHRPNDSAGRRIVMLGNMRGDDDVGIDYSKLHTDVLCASAISALISSIVHSRSPLANRSALPRSNISQNCRPSNLRGSDAPDAGYSPMMNGMMRVRTTCLRKTVRALVMVRPSSRKTSSQSRLRSSSIRNVVVLHVSLMSCECVWRVLYQFFPFETKAGMFD